MVILWTTSWLDIYIRFGLSLPCLQFSWLAHNWVQHFYSTNFIIGVYTFSRCVTEFLMIFAIFSWYFPTKGASYNLFIVVKGMIYKENLLLLQSDNHRYWSDEFRLSLFTLLFRATRAIKGLLSYILLLI